MHHGQFTTEQKCFQLPSDCLLLMSCYVRQQIVSHLPTDSGKSLVGKGVVCTWDADAGCWLEKAVDTVSNSDLNYCFGSFGCQRNPPRTPKNPPVITSLSTVERSDVLRSLGQNNTRWAVKRASLFSTVRSSGVSLPVKQGWIVYSLLTWRLDDVVNASHCTSRNYDRFLQCVRHDVNGAKSN